MAPAVGGFAVARDEPIGFERVEQGHEDARVNAPIVCPSSRWPIATIKAFTLDALGTPPAARDDLPAPTPAAGELLVRVQASSANPVDNAIAAGMLSGMVEHEFSVVLGRDYAGVVEQVGVDVTRYAVGDQVYGYLPHANPTVHDGSWAELITVPEETSVARKPDGPDAFDVYAAALQDGGRAASPTSAAGDGPGRTNVMAAPTTENLERLAQLLEAGTLRVPVRDTYELDRAGEALQALDTTHTQGKLAIRIG